MPRETTPNEVRRQGSSLADQDGQAAAGDVELGLMEGASCKNFRYSFDPKNDYKEKLDDKTNLTTGERVYEFYMINTVELTAINAHGAEIEVFMKVFWRFHDLAGAIERGQLELHDPEGHDEADELTKRMLETGIPEDTLIRGALPRRKDGSKDAEHSPLFHADPPINFKRPFENQVKNATHITPCWTAYDKKRQVLSCQVHLALEVKVANPDLAQYPIDRRVLPLIVGHKKDKNFGLSVKGKKDSRVRSTTLLVKRPDWVEVRYPEDNYALSVKWPDFSTSRKLPLDLRKHPTEDAEEPQRDKDGKKKMEPDGKTVLMKKTGRKKDQGVFVYRRDGKHHLLVMMERSPSNFLWNVLGPNWILVLAAHSSMFMEFYIETENAGENNKSLLSSQMGVGLAVLLATMANKYVALQQELPSGLPFTTLADKYFVLSYFWVAVLMTINTGLMVDLQHHHWDIDRTNGTNELDGDWNIDTISRWSGTVLAGLWTVINALIIWKGKTWRTSWHEVVRKATRPDVNAHLEHEDKLLVEDDDTGELDNEKLRALDAAHYKKLLRARVSSR